MAFMARRPPSVIALGDAELQPYLQSIFLRSLAVDLDNLRLNDLDDQSCSDANSDHGGDSGENGDSASTSSDDEAITPTFYTSAGASPGTGTTTSLKETKGSVSKLATPTPSILASGTTKSAHQAPDPGSPYTTSSKTLQSLPSLRPRGRYSLSLNIRPERVAVIMTPQGCPQKGASQRCREKDPAENHQQSHRHATQSPLDAKSRLSAVQNSRLSLGAIPDMAIDSVPLRDLALASTKSYEAVLAATMVSPSAAADPIQEYGTIQPDSVFNEPSADRGAV